MEEHARKTLDMARRLQGEIEDLTPSYACTCMTMQHDHNVEFYGKSTCARRATIAGGICTECRYWFTFPEQQENLG